MQAFSLKTNIRQLFYKPESNISIIDGLRAASIIMVIFCHLILFLPMYYPNIPNFINKLPLAFRVFLNGGVLGVNVFFVISGFLIGNILLVEYKQTQKICFTRFYIRRFLRLMPIYWIGLLAGALFGLPNGEYIWANLIYVTNFIGLNHQFMPWTWSLAVEEQFYFIFPITILFFFSSRLCREHTKMFLSLVLLLSITLNFFLVFHYNLKIPTITLNSIECEHIFEILYIKPYTCFISLFSGVVLSYLEHISEHKSSVVFALKTNNLNHIIVIFAIVFIIFMFFVGDGKAYGSINPGQLMLPILQPAFAISISYLIFYIHNYDSLISSTLKKILSLKAFYVIAQLSYSIYIFHLIVILIVYSALLNLFPFFTYTELLAFGTLVSLVAIFIISSTTYIFIERPFMNLRKVT